MLPGKSSKSINKLCSTKRNCGLETLLLLIKTSVEQKRRIAWCAVRSERADVVGVRGWGKRSHGHTVAGWLHSLAGLVKRRLSGYVKWHHVAARRDDRLNHHLHHHRSVFHAFLNIFLLRQISFFIVYIV